MMCYVYVSTAKETKTSYINVNQINHVLKFLDVNLIGSILSSVILELKIDNGIILSTS